jgi:hypothetical protein
VAGTSYQWRGRTRDAFGATSGWVDFGPSNPDFKTNAVPSNPTAAAQFQSDGTTAIAQAGSATSTTVVLKATLSDPDAGTVQLQVEVTTGAFTGTPTSTSASVASGTTATITLSGLTVGASYQWRARALDPYGATSGWVDFGGTNPDFKINSAPASPSALAQYRLDGITAIAQAATTPEVSVVLKATVSDPDADSVQLQVEVVPTGSGFTAVPTASSAAVASGAAASVTVGSLTPGTNYKWRGRTIDPYGATSGWVDFGPSDPDFKVNGDPAAPSSTAQFKADGVTSFAIGGTTTETSVVIKAACSDADGDSVKLEIEVKLVGISFSNVATGSTALGASGSTFSITVTGLALGDYHWQARAVDSYGAASAWGSFGGNGEGAADFSVIPVPNNPPSVPTAAAQFKSDGVTSIAIGATTSEATVIFTAAVSDPDAGTVRLRLELRTVGTAFSNTATHTSAFVASGGTATITVPGIADASYHWQVSAEDSNAAASSWTSFGGNPEASADFIVNTAVNNPPSAPVGADQYNGASPIPVGGSGGDTITFKGTITDPNGDGVRLEVEVKAVGTAFTNTPSAQSALVASGTEATVSVGGLSGDYHWQYRSIDASGAVSAWTSFGANPENIIDFIASVLSGGGGGGGRGKKRCGASEEAGSPLFLISLAILALVAARRIRV